MTERPNLLVMVPDQQRMDSLGSGGRGRIAQQRLARRKRCIRLTGLITVSVSGSAALARASASVSSVPSSAVRLIGKASRCARSCLRSRPRGSASVPSLPLGSRSSLNSQPRGYFAPPS